MERALFLAIRMVSLLRGTYGVSVPTMRKEPQDQRVSMAVESSGVSHSFTPPPVLEGERVAMFVDPSGVLQSFTPPTAQTIGHGTMDEDGQLQLTSTKETELKVQEASNTRRAIFDRLKADTGRGFAASKSLAASLLNKGSGGDKPANKPIAPTPTSEMLCVKIDNATNLPNMDSLLHPCWPWEGSSDAFVIVKVGSQVQQTHHVNENSNPIWNWESSPCFDVSNQTDPLSTVSLQVWDKDSFLTFGDDHMTTERINFRHKLQPYRERWIPFTLHLDCDGKVNLRMNFITQPKDSA